jgi:hypothetical protein
MEEEKLFDAGISIEYMQYDYPQYQQLHGSFEPNLSIVDLLLNTGKDAHKYI